MQKNLSHFFILALVSALLLSVASLSYAAPAGRFQFVAGEVQVFSETGVMHIAKKGEAVNQGDTLRSLANSSAQIRMADDGLIVVRPESELKISKFVFNGTADGTERSLISLVKGGFRAITGLIGKVHKESYQIQTSGATIGIRGTDHEAFFIVTPSDGQVASSTPGTYDKVNSGATVLATAAGSLVIAPNQVGFVANLPNSTPSLLSHTPDFYANSAVSNLATPAVNNPVAPLVVPVANLPVVIAPQVSVPLVALPVMQPVPVVQAPVAAPLPAKPVTAVSDRRLKRNIKRIGTHQSGLALYEWDYVWGRHATGVMADEVLQVRPDAVLHHRSGYDMVDYSKLD